MPIRPNWLFELPEATGTRTGRTFAVDALPADWVFTLPEGMTTKVGRTLTATAGSVSWSFSLPEASGSMSLALTLSDWTAPTGTRSLVLALVRARVSGVDFVSVAANPTDLVAGELEVASDLILDMLERRDPPSTLIRMRRTGTAEFRAYFGTTAIYPDALLYIQTSRTDVWRFTHISSGGGFSNWTPVDSDAVAAINALITGERLIWGMTTPTIVYTADAGPASWLMELPVAGAMVTGRTLTIDAGPASWSFSVPEATPTKVGITRTANADPASWLYELPEAGAAVTGHTYAVDALSADWTVRASRGDADPGGCNQNS